MEWGTLEDLWDVARPLKDTIEFFTFKGKDPDNNVKIV